MRQAARMMGCDWRAGELTLLLMALVLALAAFVSVSFLQERLQKGLERDARQLIAADFVVRADRPIDPQFVVHAQALGLHTATTAIFPSMISLQRVSADGAHARVSGVSGASDVSNSNVSGALSPSHLAALKAVSAGYPLRGALRIAPGLGMPDQRAHRIPPPGTVWVDAALLNTLHARVGDVVRVGARAFTINALITRELDRGFAFVNFSPRLMLRADELASTGLIGYGSRVTYRLLVAGDEAAVARFAQFAHARVDGGKMRGVTLESLRNGQPQVRQTLDRAGHFLTLVALSSALLAAVAMAMAGRRYTQRHLNSCAVMRCMGMAQSRLRAVVALEFLFIGVVGGACGVALGFAAHFVLLDWLSSLIEVSLPPPSMTPILKGFALGFVLLAGFTLPPLLPLTRVPPVRVLRREWGSEARRAWCAYAFGAALFAALWVMAAGEPQLGGLVAGGFALSVLIFSVLARAALEGLARIARSEQANAGMGWRYALASLQRRAIMSTLQIVALSIGLTCLLLVAIMRDDLIAGWHQSTPPDAPNEFLIDIQPNQRQAIEQYLSQQQVPGVTLEPMVRGRLTEINGKPVNPDAYHDDETQRLINREFNLSYNTRLPADNRLVAGHWYGEAADAQISIEAGLAKRIGIKLGDRLRFDVTGLAIDAPVTSIRQLNWDSFKVNFFVLMPPAALRDFPASYITSFYLPAQRRAVIDGLATAFPNVTVIDTAPILEQLRRVLEQVSGAVQFLFLLTLLAGALVLYCALASTQDERMRETALLRALGASHRQVRRMQAVEFAVIGLLAGLMAALGAQALGSILAAQVFDFPLDIDPWLVPVGIVAGIASASVSGWLSVRNVFRQSLTQSLRNA